MAKTSKSVIEEALVEAPTKKEEAKAVPQAQAPGHKPHLNKAGMELVAHTKELANALVYEVGNACYGMGYTEKMKSANFIKAEELVKYAVDRLVETYTETKEYQVK